MQVKVKIFSVWIGSNEYQRGIRDVAKEDEAAMKEKCKNSPGTVEEYKGEKVKAESVKKREKVMKEAEEKELMEPEEDPVPESETEAPPVAEKKKKRIKKA